MRLSQKPSSFPCATPSNWQPTSTGYRRNSQPRRPSVALQGLEIRTGLGTLVLPISRSWELMVDLQAVTVKSVSLVEQVSDKLAALIRLQDTGDAAANDTSLPAERRLAEQFGVSRQVVREAIKRLELQGLLEVRQGSGVRIIDKLHLPINHSLSLLIPDEKDRLRQLQEMRHAIEPSVVRLVAVRASDEDVASLHQFQTELQAASDNTKAIEIDLRFHRALAEASGNLMFRLILDSVADVGLESRMRTIGRVGKQTAIKHHAKIIEGIEKHDPDAAAAAMTEHLLAAGKDLEL